MFERLLQGPGIKISDQDLIIAASKGHSKVVDLLLKDGRVNPAAPQLPLDQELFQREIEPENDAIIEAVGRGHLDDRRSPAANAVEVVRLLLKDPRVDDVSPPTFVGDPSVQNNRVLIDVTEWGDAQATKTSLTDPRVDPRGKSGGMALVGAVENSHQEVVEVLLKDPKVDPSYGDYEAVFSIRNIFSEYRYSEKYPTLKLKHSKKR